MKQSIRRWHPCRWIFSKHDGGIKCFFVA